jgi:hypothetical protein
MLNKTTILLRVVIPVIAHRFMVGSRTDAIREIPSVRGIELNLRLLRIRPGQTSTFATTTATAAGEIQANKSKDSDLFGDPLPKPSTKPSSPRDNTKPKHPNPTLNRTHRSVLRPLPHAG